MRILEALLEITVFSTVIFCGIMLVKKLFQNRMSPLLHYGIWWILLLRLLLPVTVASPVRLVVIPAYGPGQALLSPAERESETAFPGRMRRLWAKRPGRMRRPLRGPGRPCLLLRAFFRRTGGPPSPFPPGF